MARRSRDRILVCLALGLSALFGTAAQADMIYLDFGNVAAEGSENGPSGVPGTWQTQIWRGGTLTGGELLTLARGDNNATSFVPWGQLGPEQHGVGALDSNSVMSNEANVFGDYVRSHNKARSFGLRLTGLAPGIYDVYLTVNPSSEAGSRVGLGLISGLGMGVQSTVDDLTQATVANLVDADLTLDAWTASSTPGVSWNYITARIEVASATDCIVVIAESANGTGSTGELGISSLQLILVPEPATMALLAMGGLAVLIRRRRA